MSMNQHRTNDHWLSNTSLPKNNPSRSPPIRCPNTMSLIAFPRASANPPRPLSYTAIYLVPPRRILHMNPAPDHLKTTQYIKREHLYACSTASGQRPLCELTPTTGTNCRAPPFPPTRHDLPPWAHKRSCVTSVRWLTHSTSLEPPGLGTAGLKSQLVCITASRHVIRSTVWKRTCATKVTGCADWCLTLVTLAWAGRYAGLLVAFVC